MQKQGCDARKVVADERVEERRTDGKDNAARFCVALAQGTGSQWQWLLQQLQRWQTILLGPRVAFGVWGTSVGIGGVRVPEVPNTGPSSLCRTSTSSASRFRAWAGAGVGWATGVAGAVAVCTS